MMRKEDMNIGELKGKKSLFEDMSYSLFFFLRISQLNLLLQFNALFSRFFFFNSSHVVTYGVFSSKIGKRDYS